ncbi:MAG: peptide chain release factor N(5)-glutamine methyltransferase [Candidatus Berkelbacteria bacterium]|nr:peptide chain release factor N(5)-glutamine methyltransferase [Candidatus Berkelbacteria bacterium]
MSSVFEEKKQIIAKIKTAGIKSAEIDAEILVESASGKSREFLLAHPKFEMTDVMVKKLDAMVTRRLTNEPIAYIVGVKEFFGLDFFVTANVLIPRPETELLVETVLDFPQTTNYKLQTILDLGAGSGNIIISLASNLCNPLPIVNELHKSGNYFRFFASDISFAALKVARKNARFHSVDDKIKFIKSDLFQNISDKFDIIVANLPYVPKESEKRKVPTGSAEARKSEKLWKKEIYFEPESAIFAADNGAGLIKKFLDQAKNHINKNGLILLEVDPRNAKNILLYSRRKFTSTELTKDLTGKDRLIKILT